MVFWGHTGFYDSPFGYDHISAEIEVSAFGATRERKEPPPQYSLEGRVNLPIGDEVFVPCEFRTIRNITYPKNQIEYSKVQASWEGNSQELVGYEPVVLACLFSNAHDISVKVTLKHKSIGAMSRTLCPVCVIEQEYFLDDQSLGKSRIEINSCQKAVEIRGSKESEAKESE